MTTGRLRQGTRGSQLAGDPRACGLTEDRGARPQSPALPGTPAPDSWASLRPPCLLWVPAVAANHPGPRQAGPSGEGRDRLPGRRRVENSASPLGVSCRDAPPSALRGAVPGPGRVWLRGSPRLPLGLNGAPSRVEALGAGANPGGAPSSGPTALIAAWGPPRPEGTRRTEEPDSGLK